MWELVIVCSGSTERKEDEGHTVGRGVTFLAKVFIFVFWGGERKLSFETASKTVLFIGVLQHSVDYIMSDIPLPGI